MIIGQQPPGRRWLRDWSILTRRGLVFIIATMLFAGALSLASIQAHALADGPGCAIVRKTPDGFLNLRKDFSMSGAIIAKLRPGDLLYVSVTELGISTLGDWVEVDGVWRLDGADMWRSDGSNVSKPRHSGWVARRFIREIKCPAKMQR
ncbi:MAG: hypothetical protein E6G76_11635 [Alphaproteobacteria bacterium]|nr:MAG: hypothetical protein E6G76_11635 [Alphaproteobacteria bacterium]